MDSIPFMAKDAIFSGLQEQEKKTAPTRKLKNIDLNSRLIIAESFQQDTISPQSFQLTSLTGNPPPGIFLWYWDRG